MERDAPKKKPRQGGRGSGVSSDLNLLLHCWLLACSRRVKQASQCCPAKCHLNANANAAFGRAVCFLWTFPPKLGGPHMGRHFCLWHRLAERQARALARPGKCGLAASVRCCIRMIQAYAPAASRKSGMMRRRPFGFVTSTLIRRSCCRASPYVVFPLAASVGELFGTPHACGVFHLLTAVASTNLDRLPRRPPMLRPTCPRVEGHPRQTTEPLRDALVERLFFSAPWLNPVSVEPPIQRMRPLLWLEILAKPGETPCLRLDCPHILLPRICAQPGR
jgi:hypothetical protein